MTYQQMLNDAEASDLFFNSPEIESCDTSDENAVREAAERFREREKIIAVGGRFSTDWFVKDFFRRL